MLYLEKEIREQPLVLAKLGINQSKHIADLAQTIRQHHIAHVIIAARGTSDNAAVYGRYALESLAGMVVSLAAPSLFTLYKQPPRLQNSLVIGVSQSGQGTDIVQVLSEAKRQQALTLAITNYGDSPLANIADETITLEAGEEHSVAATKTYTAELMTLALLASHLAEDKSRIKDLDAVPDQVAAAIALAPAIERAAERYRYMRNCAVLGRGYNYATAFEIALKLKETCYLGTQPYSTADFRHGPIAMVDESLPVLVIGPSGAVYPDVLDCAQDVIAKETEILAISDQDELLDLARTPLRMPADIPEWLSPISYVVPGQLFALSLAQTKGYNPDQPRGLKKVTKTT